MHDFLEGVLTKHFGLLMGHLKSAHGYGVVALNTDLKSFEYGRNDGKTKVPHNLFDETTKVFRLSATHC